MFFGKKARVLVRIETQVQFKVARDPETGGWIAACDALSITTSGETWDDLWEDAAEAIQAMLTDLFEDQELEQFLRENGWQLREGAFPHQTDTVPRFELPFTLNAPSSVEDLLTVPA